MQTIHRSICILFYSLFISGAFAQEQKYWITFQDKDTVGYDYNTSLSPQAVLNRRNRNIPLYQYSDIPVTANYLSTLSSMNIQVVAKSKWLNAVTAYMSPEQAKAVSSLPYVSSVEPLNVYLVASSTDIKVDPLLMHVAMKQMKAKAFQEAGINATGVKIGVIDAGFHNTHEDPALSYLIAENKIIAQRDFIDTSRKDIIRTAATGSDDHGRQVLKMIAGYDSSSRSQYGMATNATFYLARTEDGNREHRGEEDMWIMAMEWMDSMGVRLISTSLGYAIKMDDPNDNYKREEMNGKTARISIAAQIAFEKKGIFLVVSAGNEGDEPWRIISAPADAEGSLSVGATRPDVWEKIYYSSIGPDFLPYLKPNVSCFSPNGTSFSCPAVAGFVACMMQNDSTMTNVQLKDIIQKSSHLYPYGNNFIGYGIPQADRVLALAKDPEKDFGTTKTINVSGKKYTRQLDKSISLELVLFHKKNATIVVEEESLLMKKGKLKIKKPKNKEVVRTTVVANEFLTLEIIWE